jgi:hypothetical protein
LGGPVESNQSIPCHGQRFFRCWPPCSFSARAAAGCVYSTNGTRTVACCASFSCGCFHPFCIVLLHVSHSVKVRSALTSYSFVPRPFVSILYVCMDGCISGLSPYILVTPISCCCLCSRSREVRGAPN